MATYITSDLHFNHTGILKMERTQFKTVEQHNQFIVDHYNAVVKDTDTCYILGDVGFYNVDELAKWVNKLHGHKILVKGNHDRFSIKEAYEKLGFEEVYEGPIYLYLPDSPANGKIILSHEPVLEAYANPYVINVHGHLHNSDLKATNFYNVNICRTKYRPVNVNKFISAANVYCKSRSETFGHEWYYKEYNFDK